MKAFTISTALAVLTTLVAAAPAPAPASPPYDFVQITFTGAADAQYIQYFQTHGYGSGIYNPLSVSKITNPGGATCYFYGADGSQTVVKAGATADVGPPQPQQYGYCYTY